MSSEPNTLQEAILYFSNPVNCREYVVARRWPNGVTCPRCGGTNVKFMDKYNRWQCGSRHASRQFTLKTGTIFEDSPLGMDKWLAAMWQVVNCKNGISSYEVHRMLGVTQKTGWFMDRRIRRALTMGSFEKLTGEVEVDEPFIGGKARNMHKAKRERVITGTGGKDKAMVLGVLERGGKVRTQVVSQRTKKVLQAEVRKHVEAGSALYSDSLKSYEGLDEFQHQVVDHAVEYVNGRVHTNGMENFCSLLKRGINGTYDSVEPFHLHRYLDEQAFRFNHRKDMNDGDRMDAAVRGAFGRRVTYKELTGKVGREA
jgi:transposase-like protein